MQPLQTYQLLHRAVQVSGNQPAIIFNDQEWTYKDLHDRAGRFAGALKAHGLADGDRVAILALNSHRYIEYYFGVPWAGGVCVPLNIRLTPEDWIYMLNNSGSTVLIVDDAFARVLPALQDHLETVKTIIFSGEGETPDGAVNYEALLAQASAPPVSGRGGEDEVCIMYTGGTTGRPKGVMLTHNNIIGSSLNVGVFSYKGQPMRYMHVAPLFHIAGGISVFNITSIGEVHVVVDKFDPEAALQIIEKHQVTSSMLVPTMISMMLNHPNQAEYDLSSLDMIIYGASPMPLAVLQAMMERVPDCEFLQAYGMTETTGAATMLEHRYHLDDTRRKAGGQPVINTQVQVVGPDDKPLPPGEVGEIVMRGMVVMKGYWDMPDATDKALRNGWMHSGDVGYMDEAGFVYVIDRLKDMIISGGENIYSAEVENVIYQYPGVAMCAVIGVPSDEWGESVHAVVVPRADADPMTADDIIAHCKQKLAGYKVPRSVEIRSQDLPLSGAGKILKTQIRKPYWQGKERMVN